MYIFPCKQRRNTTYEPYHKETHLWILRPSKTQTGLFSYRDLLESWNFGLRKYSYYTIWAAKNKGADQPAWMCRWSARLVFAYAVNRFSPDVAHIALSKLTIHTQHIFKAFFACKQKTKAVSEMKSFNIKWATTWENLLYVICEKQRRRSACASVQSDQRLYCRLPRQYNTSSCYSQNFKTLASVCLWAGRFVSHLVANPEDRFSCGAAQIHSWKTTNSS